MLESVSFDGYTYQMQRVAVPGGTVATYSIGSGPETLLLVHGGPGMSCDYLRESHARLAGDRYRVVTYDQLGSGASDRPDAPALWLYLDKGTKLSGAHIAFRAPDLAAIAKFHAEGVKAGGRDNGGAGPRADYSPTYYAAFLIDPDGNNIEAVCP